MFWDHRFGIQPSKMTWLNHIYFACRFKLQLIRNTNCLKANLSMTDTEKEKKPLVRAYPSCVRHCTALSRAGLGRKIVLGSFQDTAPLRAESGFFRGGGGCVWNQVFTFQILNDSSAESMRHSGLGRHFLKPAPQSAKRRSRGCCSFSCSRDEAVVPVLSSP